MTIKIQDLENLQDLTEVELEKVVGGQLFFSTEQRDAFFEALDAAEERFGNTTLDLPGLQNFFDALRRIETGTINDNFVV